MRSGIAFFATCACLLPAAVAAQTAPLVETQFASPGAFDALRYDLRMQVAAPSADNHLLDENSDLRMRLGGSMVDYYPLNGAGFRLSTGLRLFTRHNFVREAERASGQRLTSRGFPGFGSGMRRYTPAAMVGYALPLFHNAEFGLEGGAVAGRLDAVAPGLDIHHSLAAVRIYQHAGINPVARAALGMRF